jgi:hypothetical protein
MRGLPFVSVFLPAVLGELALGTSTAHAQVAQAPSVFVHIESSSAVDLERRSADRPSFERVCTAPCDAYLPAQGDYQIGAHQSVYNGHRTGSDVRSSSQFSLEGLRRAELTVEPTSENAFVGGIALVVGGSLTVVASGIYAMAVGFSEASCGVCRPEHDWTGPAVTLSAGLAAIVGGVVMIVLNGRSRVYANGRTIESAFHLAAPGWSRSAEAGVDSRWYAPAAMTAPLLRVAF